MLAAVLCGGLAAVGRDVIDAGVAATPTTGVLVRQYRAAGGIQISASHNPPQYNGLKLFSPEGRVIPADAGAKVIARYRDYAPAWVAYDQAGKRPPVRGFDRRALDADLQNGRRRADSAARFSVLLDSNHGAGSVLGRRLLEGLGCQVTLLGGEPDGQFEHTPGAHGRESLGRAWPAVTEHGCDVGFCQDPDADRLAVIDAAGRYMGEEYTLAMCVDHRLRSRARTDRDELFDQPHGRGHCAEKYGVPFYRSAVGEANVVDTMLAARRRARRRGKRRRRSIPRVGLVRDSFVGMAMMLDAMASARSAGGAIGRRIAALRDREDQDEPAARADAPRPLPQSSGIFQTPRADRLDGLRLDWPGKWLLVRASNTEPIVRAVAEAPTAAEAARLCREAEAAMKH